MEKENNKYEQDLDVLIEDINKDGGMPVDAYHVVLLEYNARLLAKLADKMDQVIQLMSGNIK